jgi:hypothetical protein
MNTAIFCWLVLGIALAMLSALLWRGFLDLKSGIFFGIKSDSVRLTGIEPNFKASLKHSVAYAGPSSQTPLPAVTPIESLQITGNHELTTSSARQMSVIPTQLYW